MKAKMLLKRPEEGTYFCLKCNSSFKIAGGDLFCPNCDESRDLVIVYLEENPLEELFYSKVDWHGG